MSKRSFRRSARASAASDLGSKANSGRVTDTGPTPPPTGAGHIEQVIHLSSSHWRAGRRLGQEGLRGRLGGGGLLDGPRQEREPPRSRSRSTAPRKRRTTGRCAGAQSALRPAASWNWLSGSGRRQHLQALARRVAGVVMSTISSAAPVPARLGGAAGFDDAVVDDAMAAKKTASAPCIWSHRRRRRCEQIGAGTRQHPSCPRRRPAARRGHHQVGGPSQARSA